MVRDVVVGRAVAIDIDRLHWQLPIKPRTRGHCEWSGQSGEEGDDRGKHDADADEDCVRRCTQRSCSVMLLHGTTHGAARTG